MSLNHLAFTEGLPAAQAPLLAWHPQVEPGWGLRAQGPQKEHPQVQAGLSVQAWAPLRIEGGEAWGPGPYRGQDPLDGHSLESAPLGGSPSIW